MADNTGWFEFITAAKATSHIAYVYEDGSVYLPEGRDVVDQDDFTYAAARGRVYRLVRADELEQAHARIAELEAAQHPRQVPGYPMALADFEHWLTHGERGYSSNMIVAVITGVTYLPGKPVHAVHCLPADAGDFWRCENLLRAVPEARDHLGLAAAESPEWAALVEHWGELVALDRDALSMSIQLLIREATRG